MKTLRAMTVIAIFSTSFSANAWGPYDTNDGPNNRNGFNGHYNGNNSGYAPYRFQPPIYLPPTQEQLNQQRDDFEKAQKKALERHQKAMENFRTQAPDMQMPAYVIERRAEADKRHKERLDRIEQRRKAFRKQFEIRKQESIANNS